MSTKTIRRDLAALMEAGFPLYDERYDGKVYWRFSEEYKGLPLANLSMSEIAALYFSKKLVINLAAPPFNSDIASAFKKIESALPEKNIEFLDSLDSMISVRVDAPKDLDQHKQTIRTLLEAIGDDLKVKMQYFSVHSQKKKEYTLHPYRLMHFRGGMYLFAYVEEYEQIRTFAIERIESIEKPHANFEKPPDFSVESYLESSFGLRKDRPRISRRLCRRIHAVGRQHVRVCRDLLVLRGALDLCSIACCSTASSVRLVVPRHLHRRVGAALVSPGRRPLWRRSSSRPACACCFMMRGRRRPTGIRWCG